METTPEQVVEGKALVTVLACVLEKLIQANSNSGHDRLEADAVTKFHALRPPGIGVAEYLDRILKYSSCSNECFVLGLIYMDRFIQRNDFALTSLNVHRISITSIMVAAKFFDDQYYNNAYYAKVGGVPCAEINSLEIEFLFGLDFNLAVTAEEYGNYRERLSEHANCSTCGCVAGLLVKRQRPSPPLPLSSRFSETGRNDGGSVAQGSASGWPKPGDGYDELTLTTGNLNQDGDGPELITPASVLGNPQSSIARSAHSLGGGNVQGNGGGRSGLCAPVGTGRGDNGVRAVHRGGFDPDTAAGLERELQQQQAAFRRVQQHQQLQNHQDQQQQQQQQVLLEQETAGAEALLSIGGVTESNFYGGNGRSAPLRTTRQCVAQQQQYYPPQQQEEDQLLHHQTRGGFPAAHSSRPSAIDGASGVMPMQDVCSSAMRSLARGMKQGASTSSGNVSITPGSQRFRITPSPEHVDPFQGSSSSGVGSSLAAVSEGTGESRGGASASGAIEPTSSVFGNLSLQRIASAGGVRGSMSSNPCSNGGGSSSGGFALPAGHTRRGSTGGVVRGLGSGDLSATLTTAASSTVSAGLGVCVGGGFVGFGGGRGGITEKGDGALCMPSPDGVCAGWGPLGGGGEPLGNILFEEQEQQQQQQIPFRSQQRYRSGKKHYHQQQNHLGLSSNALQQVHSSFAGGRASASSSACPTERGHYSVGGYATSPRRHRETAGGDKASRDGLIRDTVVNRNYFGDVGSGVGVGVGGGLSNHNESGQTTSNLYGHRFSGSVSGSGLDTSGSSAYGRSGGIASNSGEGVGGIGMYSGRGHPHRNASASCGNFPMKSVGGGGRGNGGVGLGVDGLIGGHGGFLDRECLEARKREVNGSFVSTPPSVGMKGGRGYFESTPASDIGGVGVSGCELGGRAGRGGGSMYSPSDGESFFTSQRGSGGTYGFPHHGAAMLGGSALGSDGSVYVTPRSTPRHVEGETCIGEDGSSYSHQQYLDPSISYPTSQELAREGEGFDVMGVRLDQGQAARTGFRGGAAPAGGAQGTSAGWPLNTGRETWSC